MIRNETLEKPALEVLLDDNLHNLIQCTAYNFRRVYHKCSSHSVMVTQEDLTLEGYAAVTVAYQSFDPNLGHTTDVAQSFRTHVYPYVRAAMQTYCRKFGHSLSISEKAARDDFGDILSIGIIHMDQLDEDTEFDIPIGSGVKISEDVDEYFMRGFSELERALIRDYMIDDYSLEEVSQRHGLSKSRAREIIHGLRERMKVRAKDYVENN